MNQNAVFTNVEKGRVDLFFSPIVIPDPASPTSHIIIASREDGLRLANQIRHATLAVWPVMAKKQERTVQPEWDS
jgi:hypothetical protein